jgi:RNA polymerase sigma factor (sigma-70 family)
MLRNHARSEEIVQEALMKFMLASPELENKNQAIAYLKRTIENLCIDSLRMDKRRPNLVAIDDVNAESDINLQTSGDFEVQISAAEDAAIIRQALALLSQAERAALVMWEIEGRSTKEIARELGIKESSVRQTVFRARASFRKILTSIVLDEKRGLTAIDLLSNSYRKISEIANKSGRVAMSLILLISAFLGFNSLTGNENLTFENSNSNISILSQVSEVVKVNGINFSSINESPDFRSNSSGANSLGDSSSSNYEQAQTLARDLEFNNVQLESAALMLEILMSIEQK